MDTVPEEIENHHNKCRCCLRLLRKHQKTVEITNSIEKRFEKLTNVKLIIANCFSNVICEKCNSKLSEFADFQNELIENQMNLYKDIGALPDEEYIEEESLENVFEEHDLQLQPIEVKVEQLEALEEHLSPINAQNIDINDESPSFSLKTPIVKLEISKVQSLERKLCSICNETFKTKSLLQLHLKKHKNLSKSEQSKERLKSRKMCQLCGLSFATNGWYHHVSVLIRPSGLSS